MNKSYIINLKYSVFLTLAALLFLPDFAFAKSLPVPDDARLNAIFTPDGVNIWAVGDMNLIRYSADGGRSWTIQPAPQSARLIPPSLYDVFFLDSQTGWAAGECCGNNGRDAFGVIYFTSNGGRNWTSLSPAVGPLRRIKFFNKNAGIAAGAASELCPSGVTQTQDGGKTWTPIALAADSQPESWLAADFRSINAYMLLGERGGFVRLDPYRTELKSHPLFQPRRFENIVSVGNTVFVLGRDGSVLSSDSGGGAWSEVETPLDAQGVEFSAAFGVYKLITAGSPGNAVFMYDVQNRRWNSASTPVKASLNDFCFIDSRRGWAVGALGTILQTDDGGENWKTVFSGARRPALLAICLDEASIPWEALASIAARRGAIIAIEVIGSRNDSDAARLAASRRLQNAALRCGITQVNIWNGFPLPDSGRRLDDTQTMNLWNSANDFKAGLVLQENLVKKIRQWQPEAVLVQGPHLLKSPDGTKLLAQAAEDALVLAAAPTAFSYQITRTRLPVWSTQYLLSVQSKITAGEIKLPVTLLAPNLFGSIGSAAADARKILGTEQMYKQSGVAEDTVVIKIRKGLPSNSNSNGGFIAGGVSSLLRLTPRDNQRANNYYGEIDSITLESQIQSATNLQAIVQNPTGAYLNNPGVLLGNASRLTEKMIPELAIPLLEDMSAQFRLTNRANLAAEVDLILYDSYSEFPASTDAAERLLRYFASDEIAVTERGQTPFVPHQSEFQFAQTRNRLGLIFAKNVYSRKPGLYQSGEFRRVLACMERKSGAPEAETFYAQAIGAKAVRYDSQTLLNAQTETWINHQNGFAPLPVIACKRTNSPPRLDGVLSEEFWSAAAPVYLQGDKSVYPAGTEFRFACDNQFLYVSVRAAKQTDIIYQKNQQPRVYDADLSLSDRIEMVLDFDRDMLSAFSLSADSAGRPNDSCCGNRDWNPRWFIASSEDSQTWILEMAIPWNELRLTPPIHNEYINVKLYRIAPGKDAQSIPPVQGKDNFDWALIRLE